MGRAEVLHIDHNDRRAGEIDDDVCGSAVAAEGTG